MDIPNSPWHPVRHLAFWKTPEAEVVEMSAIYDELVKGDPEAKKKLDQLLSWACSEAASDEAYNNADFSGN